MLHLVRPLLALHLRRRRRRRYYFDRPSMEATNTYTTAVLYSNRSRLGSGRWESVDGGSADFSVPSYRSLVRFSRVVHERFACTQLGLPLRVDR